MERPCCSRSKPSGVAKAKIPSGGLKRELPQRLLDGQLAVAKAKIPSGGLKHVLTLDIDSKVESAV